MNTVSIGDIGESLAIAKFTKEGLTVSKPLSNNAKYDLIVEFNNKLYKVQVKTTNSIKEGKMTFATKPQITQKVIGQVMLTLKMK
jgi:Holliday junction resolvase-like predicted endonuclease